LTLATRDSIHSSTAIENCRDETQIVKRENRQMATKKAPAKKAPAKKAAKKAAKKK
jgi:hypothetical protein